MDHGIHSSCDAEGSQSATISRTRWVGALVCEIAPSTTGEGYQLKQNMTLTWFLQGSSYVSMSLSLHTQ